MSDTDEPAHPRPHDPARSRSAEAGSRQMVNHRGPEFKALLGRVTRRHAAGLPDHERGLLLTCVRDGRAGGHRSSTSCRRATRCSSVSIGVFGDRFAGHRDRATAWTSRKIRRRVGPAPRTRPSSATQLRAMAAAGTPARAVLVTHNETSTGVTNPLERIAAAVRARQPPTRSSWWTASAALAPCPSRPTHGASTWSRPAPRRAGWSPPGRGHGQRLGARLGGQRDRAPCPASTSTCGGTRSARAKGETPVDAGGGRRASRSTPRSSSSRPRATRPIFARHAAVRRRDPRGPRRDGLPPVRRPGARLQHRHLGAGARGRRLVGRSAGSCAAAGWSSRVARAALAGKVFRVGHLGDVQVEDIVRALEAIEAGSLALGIPITRGVRGAAAREAAAARSGRQLAASGSAS